MSEAPPEGEPMSEEWTTEAEAAVEREGPPEERAAEAEAAVEGEPMSEEGTTEAETAAEREGPPEERAAEAEAPVEGEPMSEEWTTEAETAVEREGPPEAKPRSTKAKPRSEAMVEPESRTKVRSAKTPKTTWTAKGRRTQRRACCGDHDGHQANRQFAQHGAHSIF